MLINVDIYLVIGKQIIERTKRYFIRDETNYGLLKLYITYYLLRFAINAMASYVEPRVLGDYPQPPTQPL